MPATSPDLHLDADAALAEIGMLLRMQRRALKITAQAAAEAAGISRVTLHRIEKGSAACCHRKLARPRRLPGRPLRAPAASPRAAAAS